MQLSTQLINSIYLFVFIFSVGLQSFAAKTFSLDSKIFEGSSVSWVSHNDGGMGSYLTMNIPFNPVKSLFTELIQFENIKLINRGEAHITVITPIEFNNYLRPGGVSIDEINTIAKQMNIQSSSFKIHCLGEGTATLKKKVESTYFIVVSSSDLINIRTKIKELLDQKSSNKYPFDPVHFFPHITVGYTKTDLHEAQGVIKDIHSCKYDLSIIHQ